MQPRPWHLCLLILVAGVAFWLLLAGPSHLLGVDTGNAGMVLLMTSLWVSLWLISRMPGDEPASTASPGEWQAWTGLVFLLLAVGYFVAKLHLFAVPGTVMENPDASRVGRNLVMLLVAWAILSSVLGRRWKQGVSIDERDRQIEARAGRGAHTALIVAVVALAVTLGFSPADRLQWATPLMLAHLLVLALLLSNLVEVTVQALCYWRDRR